MVSHDGIVCASLETGLAR